MKINYILVLLFLSASAQYNFQFKLFPKSSNSVIVSFVVQDSWEIIGTPEVKLSSGNGSQVIEPYEAISYASGTIYYAELANLTEPTYSYQVDLQRGNASVISSMSYSFLPLVAGPIDTLALIGSIDFSATFQIYAPVISVLMKGSVASFIIPGSLAADYTDASWDRVGKLFEPLSAFFPLLAAAGPTDFAPNGSAFNYENRLVMPTTGNNKYYFSYDYSNIHLVAISTFTNYTKGSPQYQWLQADLQAANMNRDNVPWIIVTGYSSMYSGAGADYLLMEELESLFLTYGVDVCVWNGHYFAQSKPMSGRYITDRFIGNGTAASPYLNADPIHLLVGTGGLDLVQDCSQLSADWAADQLCTYGFTNITADKSNLWGIFRQLPYLANFQIAKNLTQSCPSNCRGNGVCDPNSKKCVCNTNYYGTDCAIYMTTQAIIPRRSQWEYSEEISVNGNSGNFSNTGISPFGNENFDQPAAQSNQFPAVTLVSNATKFFKKSFSFSHPGSLYNATLSVKYTRQPKNLWINGKEFSVVVGDEVENFYYGGRIVFENNFILNDTFNLNGENILALAYDVPFLYFEASVDLDIKCIDGWTGPACNVTLDSNKAIPSSTNLGEDSDASYLSLSATVLIALLYANL